MKGGYFPAWALRWAHRILFAFAFVAFAYCAYVMTDSRIFQRDEDRNLERLVVAHQTGPEPGGLIGRISVARLGVSVIVMKEGTDGSTLRRTAHRDTFFRPLRGIRQDDLITITTSGGIIGS